ncbi:mutator MutT protein [Halalkalibacter wakoensis JCM 9140]|uniref:8-oxo-dGTP diphosphatase n=1 Tax=Halalkalibacter wakoensis JCM 9140 TaxID=1236970 RepID=W4Q9Z8_9BACI|nr:(deoxy)nucleoside triphosphate pyrophosphohydrolase [Halalkalibacter wakoensis]GAE28473.1 mutator MutT protein [Halalkalibacter wakoensis JCM 9140]
MKKTIKVVAAILENEQNEILCALRSPTMSLPNMWEFPGGKVEKDEHIFAALKREIMEEIQCEIEPLTLFHEYTHEYEQVNIHLIAIKGKMVRGTPIALEHAKLIWLKRQSLNSLHWAPADVPAVNTLIQEVK